MRGLWLILSLLPAVAGAADCLSRDGQLTVSYKGGAFTGVTLRLPGDDGSSPRVVPISSADVLLSILAEEEPVVAVDGCQGLAPGTIAVRKTTRSVSRQIRLTQRDGGAFPPGLEGRSEDGDALERWVTCTTTHNDMVSCQ